MSRTPAGSSPHVAWSVPPPPLLHVSLTCSGHAQSGVLHVIRRLGLGGEDESEWV